MEKNLRFNVPLSQFAYLTGRSLATCKRDFGQLFREPPSRWLVQRRLREAHFLLQEQGLTPSEAYLEVGFENLSHFSFAFKKTYGRAPSELAKKPRSPLIGVAEIEIKMSFLPDLAARSFV